MTQPPRLVRPSSTAVLLFLFAAFWLWHLNDVALSPPVDVIEQLVWVRSLEWGYYKHPPLPTWLLWPVVQVLGWQAWSAYLLGAACTLVSVALMAALVRAIEGPRTAWVCLLAALCITFYNGRLYYYNHNVAMMPFVAAAAWCWWRLLTRPGWLVWLALGVVSAAGMLCKYEFALTVFAGAGVFVHAGFWRERRHWLGALLAATTGLLLCAPHAVWLLTSPHSPIQYALESSLGAHLGLGARLRLSIQFELDWLFNRCLLALLLLLCVRFGGALAPVRPTQTDVAQARGRLLLLWWGVLPPVLMGAMGLLWGVEQQLQWSTAFVLWTVPLLARLLRLDESRWQEPRWWRLSLAVWLLLQALVFAHSYRSSSFGAQPSNPPHWRQFDSRALADDVLPGVRAAAHGVPIRVVRSDSYAVSGALALQMPEQPRVLIDGDLRLSPWLRAEDLVQGPVLNLWEQADDAPPDASRTPAGRAWRLEGAWK